MNATTPALLRPDPPPAPSVHPPFGCSFPHIVAALTIIAGGLVLAGWALGVRELTTLGLQGKPMVANSAICFILSGAALLFLKTQRQTLPRIAQACAITVAVIALLTLGEYQSGRNLGLDELLFPDRFTQSGLPPGRMAPNSMLAFLLTASASGLLSRPTWLGRRRPWILGALGLVVLMLGITSILGYLAGFRGFYSWWQFKSMSQATALLFILLGAAVLAYAREKNGRIRPLGRWSTLGLATGMAVIITLATVTLHSNQKLQEASLGVLHARKVAGQLHLLMECLENEHRNLHDYLATGQDDRLQTLAKAVTQTRTLIPELRALTATNAVQQANLARAEPLITAREAEFQRFITAYQGGGSTVAMALIQNTEAPAVSDQINAVLYEMVAEEDRLLAERQTQALKLSERAEAILPIGLLLSSFLLIAGLLRQNAEEAARSRYVDNLRRSEELKDAIFNSMPAEIALLDPTGVIVAVNEPWLRYARENGAPDEGLIGVGASYLEACRRGVTNGDPYAAKAVTGIEAVLNGTRAEFQLEYPCPSPTQSLWYLLLVSPIRGTQSGAVVAHLDITARKQAEEALHTIEGMYRRLLLNLEAGIVVHAPDTSIVMNNTRASEILGLSADQMSGKTAIDPTWRFINEDKTALPLSLYPVNRVLAEKKPIKNQILGIQRPGETNPVWVLVNGFPEWDNHENIKQILISFFDITARKEAEEKIRILNAELEQRVAERTAELNGANANIQKLNDDLNTRAAKLEEVNKELEAFSYSVSHDLRAPLRAIDGYARMATEDFSALLDDNGRRLLKVIGDEAKRMSRLIDDLLAFSRISRQQTEPVTIDMQAMAQEVYNELIKSEPGRTVKFDLQELPAAQGTPAMIQQVWTNLISNALKFTRKRPDATIEIGAKVGADGGWVYHVKDNGAGFDMRHVGKLFGVFQRLHNQTDFEGTGVGLALVQRILQRHGGRIWAEGEVDKGACFYFTLAGGASAAGAGGGAGAVKA